MRKEASAVVEILVVGVGRKQRKTSLTEMTGGQRSPVVVLQEFIKSVEVLDGRVEFALRRVITAMTRIHLNFANKRAGDQRRQERQL